MHPGGDDRSGRLSERRRRFHRYPEPAWREFYTTALIADALEGIGVDHLAVGSAAYDPDDRLGVPAAAERRRWFDRARERGVDPGLLDAMAGGTTGAVAVVEGGEGPTVGLRVDIDGLFVEEAADADHDPAARGFRSEYPETMHACGHDAHIAIGLGVLDAIDPARFGGRLIVFFQPAEETAGGGKPMAESRYADDLDYLLAVHVGLDHPTGEVVAGAVRPLAISHLTAEFSGTGGAADGTRAGSDDAVRAAATAVQSLSGITRDGRGTTRVNVGRIDGGTASAATDDRTTLRGEVRGETTAIRNALQREFERGVHAAARMHDCEARVRVDGASPRADSDADLAALVHGVARDHEAVDSAIREAEFRGSEDATHLMSRVQANGGRASYVFVGTDHPSSHHTPRFDVDESSLHIGVSLLTESTRRVVEERPGFDADGSDARP